MEGNSPPLKSTHSDPLPLRFYPTTHEKPFFEFPASREGPTELEKRPRRRRTRGLDPDTKTPDSGSTEPHSRHQQPSPLFSSSLRLPAFSRGSRNQTNSGRVGFPRRERRGWFSSSPRRLYLQAAFWALRASWAAQWLPHAPMYLGKSCSLKAHRRFFSTLLSHALL